MQQMGAIVLQAAKLVLEAMPLLQSMGKNAPRLQATSPKEIIQHRGASADHLHDEGRKALLSRQQQRPWAAR